jgi:hypothetical protein
MDGNYPLKLTTKWFTYLFITLDSFTIQMKALEYTESSYITRNTPWLQNK